jgi:hypothetical protein
MIRAAVGLLIVSAACPALAQTSSTNRSDSASRADTAVTVSFGAFVDSYYAYDFGRPKNFDRLFTTQAARHNEFNVNLGYVEAKLTGARVRGRLALQAGTSVQSNYSGEPTIGSVSGPNLSRFLQEAFAGYAITPKLWIDGGICFSWIGMEGFISRDNLTYTRSLSADYTPYYMSGARVTWQPSPKLTALFAVVNGWQNISETNQDKGVGTRLDFTPTSTTTLSYYDFFGNEVGSGRLRTLNGVGLKSSLTRTLTVQANFDYGTQDKPDNVGHSSWWSSGLIGKAQVTPTVGVSARIERYSDPDQVIVVTGVAPSFKSTTASAGIDVAPLANLRVLWRNEVRGTWADNSIFPDRSETSGLSKHNYVVVTSLALTF